MPDDAGRTRRSVALAFGSAMLGGAVGWTLLYIGVGIWGLVVGAATVVLLATAVNGVVPADRPTKLVPLVLGCVLLSWPLVWVVVVFLRYWISGQDLGA